MSEITGFNPEQAKRNINDTTSALYKIMDEYASTSFAFFLDLSIKWASPKAKEFGDKYQPMVKDAALDIYKLEFSLSNNSIAAYDALATSNGYPTFRGDNGPYETSVMIMNEELDYLESDKLFKEDFYGTVGMNVLQAKEILANYSANVNSLVQSLGDVPVEIAFYDPGSEMASAYRNAVEKIKEKILSTTQSIETDVKSAMEEEVDTILLAKQNATDTLSA